MINVVVRMTRYGVLLFWIAFALSITGIIPSPYGLVIAWIAVFVLLIHFAEFLLIKFGYIELAGAKVSFVKTMLFGLTYWVPLLKESSVNQ
jgi:uncharacterized protein YhhL (DUF1145 family)